MTIPNQLIEKWKVLRSEADAEKIVIKASEGIKDVQGFSVSVVTVRTALRDGKSTDELFKVIAEYYEEKAKMIKEYI